MYIRPTSPVTCQIMNPTYGLIDSLGKDGVISVMRKGVNGGVMRSEHGQITDQGSHLERFQ